MFIRKIGPFTEGKYTRTLNYGNYKGKSITVDNFRDHTGKIMEKRFVVWDDLIQRIFFKKRKSDGKGFEWESQ